MLLQRTTTIAKKLLVDDKKTACAKNKCLLGVICKDSNRKTFSGETFCFLENLIILCFE